MKSIVTLIPDIQRMLTGSGGNLTSISEFTLALTRKLSERVQEERSPTTLRLSNLGAPCKRKLWYSINLPSVGEALSADTHFKFLYGDLIEETVLWLAKESGHKVEGEQNEVSLFGVVGHIDAIIDGVLVDVKSASTASFNRFAAGLRLVDDSFGYLTQLDVYQHSLAGDSRLTQTDKGMFLAVDKTLGKICLDIHPKSMIDYQKVIKDVQTMLSSPSPPSRYYQDEPFGKSGNFKLGMVCSYCSFKFHCWPVLRVFNYSTGPVYLTRVVRPPDVNEIK